MLASRKCTVGDHRVRIAAENVGCLPKVEHRELNQWW
jgi:hypothetical protein